MKSLDVRKIIALFDRHQLPETMSTCSGGSLPRFAWPGQRKVPRKFQELLLLLQSPEPHLSLFLSLKTTFVNFLKSKPSSFDAHSLSLSLSFSLDVSRSVIFYTHLITRARIWRQQQLVCPPPRQESSQEAKLPASKLLAPYGLILFVTGRVVFSVDPKELAQKSWRSEFHQLLFLYWF